MNQAWRTSDFLHTSSSTGSHSWKALIQGRNLIQSGLRWVVRTGHHINFWTDHWLPPGPIRGLVHGPLLQNEYNYSVARLINENQQWDFTPLSMVLPSIITQYVFPQSLPLHRSHLPTDIRAWNNQSGICSVESAYLSLLDKRTNDRGVMWNSWTWIWMLNLPPKIKLFLRKCAHHRIPTKSIIFNHMPQPNRSCPRCVEDETPIHVLRDCTLGAFGCHSPRPCSFLIFSTLTSITGVNRIPRSTPDWHMFHGMSCFCVYGLGNLVRTQL
uniref:Reverse transcriptase zinc-binding domain-containing protein n=1 Tax=Quercus lobata TaxID=97700 RepID=A0A7N2MQW9_QUELO